MNNLTQRQIIAIGIVCLFGIPICIGFAIGYFVGFWDGVVVTVVAIAIVAFIAQRWSQKRAGYKGKDDDNKD